MTHDELVEKVARALRNRRVAKRSRSALIHPDSPPCWWWWTDDAEAVIAVMREVLESLAEGDPLYYLEDLEYIIKAAGMVEE